MLPTIEDKKWHKAFYNNIRSNNIKNLDKLINEWPHNLEELDEVLAKAYDELKLKNVRLENKTEIFIENKLLELRFFSDTSRHDQSIRDVDLNNTRERIELTVESIGLLKTDCPNVDGKFIFFSKCIAKNIHILKHQLKFSKEDRLVCEQMEFCLVIFIASYTKVQEVNLFYRTTLNKSKILNHLENFANKLEAQICKLQSSKHEQKVTKMINSCPQLEEDNQKIREVQSLVKISDHIKNKILVANPKNKDGQLVIEKALKLIGEHLKSTLEFSSESLLQCFQENTRKIIVDLPALIPNSLSERIEKEKTENLNFLFEVHNDIKKVGDAINNIFDRLTEVELANGEKTVDQNKLISLQEFKSYSFGQDQNSKGDNDNNKIKEIEFLIQSISKSEEVDETIIFGAKSIAQNSKIKQQMKSTCEKFHWDELQFCLDRFVTSYTKKQEMNPFYRALLDKSRILGHLENFAKILEDGNSESERVVKKKSNLEFEELFKDYQQVRDVHSLKKMNDHIELALTANPNERNGQLIITRVLQVIGEHLYNTPESPKLSDTYTERLQLSLQRTTRGIIMKLRDLLLHDDNDSFSKRKEIEKKIDDNFFSNVKNDMKKIGDVITDILYNNQIDTMRILLKQIVGSKNSEEIKEVAELLTAVQFDTIKISSGNIKMMEHEKLEKLMNDLSLYLFDKTDSEKDTLNQIANELRSVGNRSENLRSDYIKGIATLKILSDSLALIKLDDKRVELIKLHADKTLVSISSKPEPRIWKKVADLSMLLYYSVWSRKPDNLNIVTELIFRIFNIAEFGTRNIKYIEKFRDKLNEKGSKVTSTDEKLSKQTNIYNVTEKKYHDRLAVKLSELKRILRENSLSSLSTEKLSFYKKDKKTQAVVEMLLLDIMEILPWSKENNLLFLDDHAPLLNGKCLRNHLAHDNALFDVLSDPSIAIILNAKKLSEENVSVSKKKIDKLVKLREKYNRDLFIVTNQERMFVALEEGNLETVKDCLNKGADVNARSINSSTTLQLAAKGPCLEVVKFIFDQNLTCISNYYNGHSPLHIAAAHGRKSIVEFLAKNTSLKVNDGTSRDETPLHFAAQNGHKDTVEVLLENKANTITHDLRGRSPLHYAIRNNHTDIAKILLKKDKNFVNLTVGNYTPLHIAANCNNLELVNFLLENNVQINAKTVEDSTPLHLATSSGHLEVVNALIENGADVNAIDLNNCMALHNAIEKGHEEIANVLLKHTNNVSVFQNVSGESFIHFASRFGQLGIVKKLLDYGADANLPNIEGQTSLHVAAYFGHSDICSVFIKHDATIDARDKKFFIPLHYAAEHGRIETAVVLIKNGADLNAKGSNGRTPLHVAALQGHKDIIDLLIKKKAKVKVKDIYGGTALHEAAKNGNKDVVKFLIKKKAKINAATKDGMTPLHEAALRGHRDAIDLLIRKKANVNVGAKNGLTPLEAAVLGAHKDAVNLLIENHAKVDKIGMCPSTTLRMASEKGYKEIVEVLAKEGADVNINYNDTGTPLVSAIRFNYKETIDVLLKYGANVTVDALKEAICTGHTDIVEMLLAKEDIVNTPLTIENTSPLHVAVHEGHKEIVNVLLETGADRNAIMYTLNIIPVTPLLLAAEKGDEEMVEILIKGGSDVNFELPITPLHIAVEKGHSNVVNVLLQYNADIDVKLKVENNNATPVELAVENDHLPLVKMLFQNKKKAKGTKGSTTLLHRASQKGNLQMVQYLVDKGFDINARNGSGAKSMHLAARDGHKDTVDFFLKTTGLSIDDPGETNKTLLHYSAQEGHLEVVNYLIVQGADVNAKDDDGLTALHVAVQFGYKEVIKILLKNGAIYNAVDKLGKIPLQLAEDKEVIKLLTSTDKLFLAVELNRFSKAKKSIKAGAFVNAKNIQNWTPLHYSARKGYEEIVYILLKNNANPNVVRNEGLTPLHDAAMFSHPKIVKALLSNYAIYNPVCDGGETPSDFTTDESITSLFKLVEDSFKNIIEGNPQVVDVLNKIKDKDTIKAIMRARNRENKSLVVVALLSNYSQVEQLKGISQGDISGQINAALKLFHEGNYQKALSEFNSAYKVRKDILGSDNPGTLDIQTYIAQVLFEQGAYQEALTTYEQIFQKRKEILGFHCKVTLSIRSTIAVVLHKLEKYEEAFNVHHEVYQKQKELLGSNHLDTLVTQLHMALVFRVQEKYEEALSIVVKIFEEQTEMVIKMLRDAITPTSTAALSQSNIEMLENYIYILGTEEVTLITIDRSENSDSSLALLRLRHDPSALEEHIKVLNIQKCVLGPNHRKTLDTQFHIANILFTQGQWFDAFEKYKKVLDPLKLVCGPNHPSVLYILKKLETLNLRFKNIAGRTLKLIEELFEDAQNGNVEIIKKLKSVNSNELRTVLHARNNQAKTLLQVAILNKHNYIVSKLLEMLKTINK